MADNVECFTRADWRPGKKHTRRKRKNPYAGRKVAPEAFVENGKRHRWTKGRPGARICEAIKKKDGQRCGMLAMRGIKVCRVHGGYLRWGRMGELIPNGKAQAMRSMRETQAPGPAPVELLANPEYQRAPERQKARMVASWHHANSQPKG